MRQRVSGGWRAWVQALAPRRGCRGPAHSKASRLQGAGGQWGDGSAGVAWPELERPQHHRELPAPAWQRTEEGHHLVTQEEPAGDPTGRCCHPCSGGGAETQVLSPLGARPHPHGAGALLSPEAPPSPETRSLCSGLHGRRPGPSCRAASSQRPGDQLCPPAPGAAERLWASVPRGTSGLGNERGFVSAVRSLPHGSCILREMNTAPPPPPSNKSESLSASQPTANSCGYKRHNQ